MEYKDIKFLVGNSDISPFKDTNIIFKGSNDAYLKLILSASKLPKGSYHIKNEERRNIWVRKHQELHIIQG